MKVINRDECMFCSPDNASKLTVCMDADDAMLLHSRIEHLNNPRVWEIIKILEDYLVSLGHIRNVVEEQKKVFSYWSKSIKVGDLVTFVDPCCPAALLHPLGSPIEVVGNHPRMPAWGGIKNNKNKATGYSDYVPKAALKRVGTDQ